MARGPVGARRAARQTRGYRQHPQLARFRGHAAPELAIDAHLAAVREEASERGYAFDRSKLGAIQAVAGIEATSGQLACEWEHLLRKLVVRHAALAGRRRDEAPACLPLFVIAPGPIAAWERS